MPLIRPNAQVARVFHPALPSHPQHALFKRDFSGSTGLFSFQLSDDFSSVRPPHATSSQSGSNLGTKLNLWVDTIILAFPTHYQLSEWE